MLRFDYVYGNSCEYGSRSRRRIKIFNEGFLKAMILKRQQRVVGNMKLR